MTLGTGDYALDSPRCLKRYLVAGFQSGKSRIQRVFRSLVWRIAYVRWRCHIAMGRDEQLPGVPSATAILLSYKRPKNIEPIVRALLRCAFIDKVIVSNNNPAVRIGDWVHLTDPRIRLIDQTRDSPPGLRFAIAFDTPAEHFLCIDDDIFPYPKQV